jgi:hypothetical protein
LLAQQPTTPPADALIPAPEELAAYAQQQWEALLLYLVGGSNLPPQPPSTLPGPLIDVPGLLAAAGLMTKGEQSQMQCELGAPNKVGESSMLEWGVRHVGREAVLQPWSCPFACSA